MGWTGKLIGGFLGGGIGATVGDIAETALRGNSHRTRNNYIDTTRDTKQENYLEGVRNVMKLEKNGNKEAIETLRSIYKNSTEPGVRKAAIKAIDRMRNGIKAPLKAIPKKTLQQNSIDKQPEIKQSGYTLYSQDPNI